MSENVLVNREDFDVIRESYSADKIPDGKIRAPFRMFGRLYVCTGHSQLVAHACRLTPLAEFDGTPTTYGEKTRYEDNDWSKGSIANRDPQGFYHGMTVKQGGNVFVLTGPEVTFQVAQKAREEAA